MHCSVSCAPPSQYLSQPSNNPHQPIAGHASPVSCGFDQTRPLVEPPSPQFSAAGASAARCGCAQAQPTAPAVCRRRQRWLLRLPARKSLVSLSPARRARPGSRGRGWASFHGRLRCITAPTPEVCGHSGEDVLTEMERAVPTQMSGHLEGLEGEERLTHQRRRLLLTHAPACGGAPGAHSRVGLGFLAGDAPAWWPRPRAP